MQNQNNLEYKWDTQINNDDKIIRELEDDVERHRNLRYKQLIFIGAIALVSPIAAFGIALFLVVIDRYFVI